MPEPRSLIAIRSVIRGGALTLALAVLAAGSASAQAPAGRVYVPIAPCRIVDTRIPSPNPLVAGTTRTFNVVGSTNDFVAQGGHSGGCGIPGFVASVPQVQAVMFNFVAVNVAGAGDLRAWAADQALPLASILNYAALPGLNLANGISVPVRQDVEGNDLSVRADVSGADLVVDVVGYFSDFAPGQVVRSLSGQTDHVTLSGSNGLSVTAGSGTVTVTSSATPSNTASTIVSRDASGNFAAGTITGNLNGTATTALNFSGSLAGEVTGTQGATVVTNAVSFSTSNAIVRRDPLGNFSAGTVTLLGNLALPATGGGVGSLMVAGSPFLHDWGVNNTFVGANAGNMSMGGSGGNTAVGFGALSSNAVGAFNAAFGAVALSNNTTGTGNTAFGANALLGNTTGDLNAAFGNNVLESNSIGSYNSAFGSSALFNNTAGFRNSAFGFDTLSSNSAGLNNSAFGHMALLNLTTGDANIGIGSNGGSSLTTGSNNIYIGNTGVASESGTIRIGTSGTQTATFMAGVSGATSSGGVAVFVNGSGQLGTATSSRRFKEEIADMGMESNVLMNLRPVAFYYKPEYDDTRTRQYGLVAEEVAEVAPELVVSDKNGAPQTVRYHFVNAMLLNEVQKQRRLIARQQAEIHDLAARLARLEAALERR